MEQDGTLPQCCAKELGQSHPKNPYEQVKLPKMQEPQQRGTDAADPKAWPRTPSPPPSTLAARSSQDQYAARSRRAPGCYHLGRVTKQLHAPPGAGGWELQALGLVKKPPHTQRLRAQGLSRSSGDLGTVLQVSNPTPHQGTALIVLLSSPPTRQERPLVPLPPFSFFGCYFNNVLLATGLGASPFSQDQPFFTDETLLVGRMGTVMPPGLKPHLSGAICFFRRRRRFS